VCATVNDLLYMPPYYPHTHTHTQIITDHFSGPSRAISPLCVSVFSDIINYRTE